jgi:GTP-binding protein Era
MSFFAIHDSVMTRAKENSGETRCGFAAMIGEPNVGKSTLVNAVLKEKISIVTAKLQTTRNRIIAVHNDGPIQVIFIDTPGIHRPQSSLGRYMMETAESAIKEADVLAWLIDVGGPKRPFDLTESEREIGEKIVGAGRPVLVLLNKIDLIKDKKRLLPLMESFSRLELIKEVIPISALKEEGIEVFQQRLVQLLPKGPKLYPEDMLSEQAERFFVAELIREGLTDLTHMEIPYHSAVVIDSFVEESTRCAVQATIHVERKSQRMIVVGSKGTMIKQISQRARQAAQKFLGCPVDLRLHVSVSPGWTRSRAKTRELGYE